MDKRCPLKLRSLPDRPCPEGEKAIKALRNGEEGCGCTWFLNDPQSNYCVWKYLADNNGTATKDSKIALLLMDSDANVKRILQNFKRRANAQRPFDED